MDELRGPSIQIVLHIKEGLGFGFLRSPFIVSGSLNGYILETDPTVPTHAPYFDAELVWEADKRRFRSLRVQNVPVKIEVFSVGTQGKKDKIGYLLLSLLGAQPCPSNKLVDVKHTWHRLLGVKAEGKCCHPQLLMSLTIEDRAGTLTPRNELRMFHSTEAASPALGLAPDGAQRSGNSVLLTLNEYIAESKKTVSSPDLQPQLVCDDGLIQIGEGKHLFVLSITIASVENLDLLLPDSLKDSKESVECYMAYSVFTHNIMTDRVRCLSAAAHFNLRTALRLRAALRTLARYFAECPLLVARLCVGDNDIGICSLDLRKLVPTDELKLFLHKFCNSERALSISERCFLLRCAGASAAAASAAASGRRPFVDVHICLKYVGVQKDTEKPQNLTSRSATQLTSASAAPPAPASGSCTDLGVGRTTTRYASASGDASLHTNEIAKIIKNMCESFTQSQEKLIASRLRPTTSDAQIQCDAAPEKGDTCQSDRNEEEDEPNVEKFAGDERLTARPLEDLTHIEHMPTPREPKKLETSKSDTCIHQTCKSQTCVNQNEKDMVKLLISNADRDAIMQRFVDELEDWKEKQQQLFTCQLKRKEEYHLELLSREWSRRRSELESRLRAALERGRLLAAALAQATDDFRLRGYRNSQRENKLLDAKKALEAHYTAKYQELREASQKMEDDMNHQLKLKDMRIEELEHKLMQMEKQIENLKASVKNSEKDAESRYSGLTKDQTASLIQELRCLEEKLDSSVQSKAFFKEQWGRAVRELHQLKLHLRKMTLLQLQHDRRELQPMDPMQDQVDNNLVIENELDLKKLKDDFYVDLLANTPGLESHSILSNSGAGGIDMCEDFNMAAKNPLSEKLTSLIARRDALALQPRPDQLLLRRLNRDIRAMLLNCGT
ncbi:uncharacterized protein LOC128676125 [Plodia interpunctella]|uniref:uncharacterized protein LOC128676125 n=1 Tax=Plodia interpunctella TaxID=58824 RepID=UPI002367D88A|nr:uncharacterized protein LOC128676125 [Plodia interpunctella]